MEQNEPTRAELIAKNKVLAERLCEAEQTIKAIQGGEVDALVIQGLDGERLYTLKGADHGYRILVQSITEGALILSYDDSIYWCNHRFGDMLQIPIRKIIGKTLDSFIDKGMRGELAEHISASRSCGTAKGEFHIQRLDGTFLPVNLSLNWVSLEHFQGVCAIVTDLSEQKQIEEELRNHRTELERMVEERTMDLARTNAELVKEIMERKRMGEDLRKARDDLELMVQERTAELRNANGELRQISSRLIAAQEEERRRLASELHDGIGQTFAAVKFWIEMALRLRDEGDASAALNHLERFVPVLQRSIEETRSIYMGLRPSMLDNMGLLATLEWLRGECMKLYPQRHIELEAGVAENEIPENLKVNMFRIAQEALNNVAKHSKAEWVDISLSRNGNGIELVISDDGVGMNLEKVYRTSTNRSLGLTSMRERAELTEGSLSIESTPGKGTTIRVYWPIEAQD